MATTTGYEIICANRNVRGVIVRVEGEGWSLSTYEAIMKILSGQIQITIRINGVFQHVGVRGSGSDAYLALENDGYPLHNLPDLQSCGSTSFQRKKD